MKLACYDEKRIKSAIAKLEDAMELIEYVTVSKAVSEEYEMLSDLIRALTYKLEK